MFTVEKRNLEVRAKLEIQAQNGSKYAKIALMSNGLQKIVECIKYYIAQICTLGLYDSNQFKPAGDLKDRVTLIKGIKEIDKENWNEVMQTLRQWIDLSEQKVFDAFGEKSFVLARNGMYGIKGHLTAKLFEDQITVCKSIVNSLLQKKNGIKPLPKAEKWDTVLVFYDENKAPQSIALYDYSENHLAYLVTHSNNISDPINQNQIRGTATKIMQYLIKISNIKNRNFTLSTFGRAKTFYEKFGFVVDTNKSYKPGWDAIPMIYKVAQ